MKNFQTIQEKDLEENLKLWEN